MIERLIELSVRNRFVVLLLAAIAASTLVWGAFGNGADSDAQLAQRELGGRERETQGGRRVLRAKRPVGASEAAHQVAQWVGDGLEKGLGHARRGYHAQCIPVAGQVLGGQPVWRPKHIN